MEKKTKRHATKRFYFIITYIVLAIIGGIVLAYQNKGTVTEAIIIDNTLPESVRLVNHENPIKSNDVPSNLINIYDVREDHLIGINHIEMEMDATAFRAAQTMFQAAKEEGITGYVIVSAYRSYAEQRALYIAKKDEGNQSGAIEVAPPGQSEHQTGLAMDISNQYLIDAGQSLKQNAAETAEGKWILENCWDYGFVLRYPQDKVSKTGVIYEPWHYRYVGLPHSQVMRENNWCLEEYVQQLKVERNLD